jgi:hypothetical protein
MTDQLDYAYVGDIAKYDEQPDGTLMVYGKMTGPDLDHDGQRCDPGWLKTAVPDWFEWANVREQHGSVVAGVGKELTQDGSNYYLKSHVVDPGTVLKVKHGALKGYSVGIKNGRILKTADAPNGLIKAGFIAEVSLVDRPCNPTCGINIAKSADGATELLAVDVDEADIDTEAYAVPEVEPIRLNDPNGDPRVTELGLSDRVEFSDPYAASLTVVAYKAACRTVEGILDGTITKALAADGTVDESGDIAGAHGVIAQIADLIISEATELKTGRLHELRDIEVLVSAARALCCFIDAESMQHGGEPGAYGEDDGDDEKAYMIADADKALEPEILKEKYSAEQKRAMLARGQAMRNPAGDPSYPIGDEADLSDAIRAVGRGSGSHASIKAYIKRRAKEMGKESMLPDTWTGDGGDAGKSVTSEPVGVTLDVQAEINKALTEVNASHKAEMDSLRDQMAKVLSAPIPGGPMIHSVVPPAARTAVANKAAEADRYLEIAERSTEPTIAEAYRALADRTRREAAAS